MKANLKSFVTGIASVLALSVSAVAQGVTPPWVTIRSISYAGSGCPAGSVAEDIAPDFTAFTLLFDSFIAEAGPGVPTREMRKNCQINVALDFPSGWSFTVVDVDYRGYGYLDRNVEGTQKSTYYFQGSSRSAALQTVFRGPMDRDYHIRDTLGLDAVVWSPCGATRSLNINSEVRVNNTRNRNGSGILTLDSIDGQLTHVYGLLWRRC